MDCSEKKERKKKTRNVYKTNKKQAGVKQNVLYLIGKKQAEGPSPSYRNTASSFVIGGYRTNIRN